MAEVARQVLLSSGLTLLSQPLMYVKVLVQVGYEPLPPALGRDVFGRQVYQLPGLFCYAQYIVAIQGKRGLLSAFGPRLCSGVLGALAHGQTLQRYQERFGAEEPQRDPLPLPLPLPAHPPGLGAVARRTAGEILARSAATLLTHPFHVITLRSLVQFVGRECKYCGLGASIVTIYREEGLHGFYAGLVPRLLGDILSLGLCHSLAYVLDVYAADSELCALVELRSYSQVLAGFIASSLTYPFVLVSTLMAVNRCGLAAGCPPFAAAYSSWLDCWRELQKEGNLSRGKCLFFRKVPCGKIYYEDLRTLI